MKNIIVLGATGSIGDSVLSVIKQNKNKLNLLGISFGSNISKAKDIINEFRLKNVYSESDESHKSLKHAFKNNYELNILKDKSELEELLNKDDVDIIVSAISGFAGLESTIMAAKTGKTILLANKESIVVAGDVILPLAKEHSTEIIPIDSEHNAIFQCLNSDKNTDDVSKIIITASGGPFLNKSISELSQVTKNEALNHPNWEMGEKITIDSASLVNKCLELIEARYLFDLEEKFFEIVVHPQSIIHSIVTYKDGSSISQMSNPDMRVPIAHALSVSNRRLNLDFSEIDFSTLSLTFQKIPEDRTQIFDIARYVCNNKGSSGIIFNAANEVAVQSFLNEDITFDKIYEVIYRTFDTIPMSKDVDLNTIYEIDNQTRIKAEKVVKSIS
jgi:1-deoxy-D-xylulose-5-phosphate reductoisomerase|tara:strand:- start:14826 stop:15989 length:1164 start_codon:yes stop_codon:yes gene_type:complete